MDTTLRERMKPADPQHTRTGTPRRARRNGSRVHRGLPPAPTPRSRARLGSVHALRRQRVRLHGLRRHVHPGHADCRAHVHDQAPDPRRGTGLRRTLPSARRRRRPRRPAAVNQPRDAHRGLTIWAGRDNGPSEALARPDVVLNVVPRAPGQPTCLFSAVYGPPRRSGDREATAAGCNRRPTAGRIVHVNNDDCRQCSRMFPC